MAIFHLLKSGSLTGALKHKYAIDFVQLLHLFLRFLHQRAAADSQQRSRSPEDNRVQFTQIARKNKQIHECTFQEPFNSHANDSVKPVSVISAADEMMQMYGAIFRLLDPFCGLFFSLLLLFYLVAAVNVCNLHVRDGRVLEQRQVMEMTEDQRDPYHSAVGHGALGFAGTLGALPPLWVSVGRLADLEDIPGRSGAVFAPIRCRTHAYTSTNKTAPMQKGFVFIHPPDSTTFLFLPHRPAPPGISVLSSV